MIQRNSVQRTSLLKCGLLIIAGVFIMLSPTMAQSQKPNPPQPVNPAQPVNGVYKVVEIIPSFPGGAKAFTTFLSTNIKYPAADRERNLTGKVIAQFIVERDGAVSNIKVLRTPSEAMGDESIRVLSMSPKWKPGMQKGKAVRAEYTVPINFALSKD